MRVLRNDGEVDRRYDLETGELVVTEEKQVAYHWDRLDKSRTDRFERRVRLTPGELEYLHWFREKSRRDAEPAA